ncbi:hypothetical protein ACTEMJ_10045, partial [Streptococcus pneumoniae]
DEIRPFFFDVESDENSFLKVVKVPKTKGSNRPITEYLANFPFLRYTVSRKNSTGGYFNVTPYCPFGNTPISPF